MSLNKNVECNDEIYFELIKPTYKLELSQQRGDQENNPRNEKRSVW